MDARAVRFLRDRSYFAFVVVLVAVGSSGFSSQSWAQGASVTSARPRPTLRPEARPDEATVEAGRATRIEVLANDIGVPGPDRPPPEMRIEGHPECGAAKIDGRAVVFMGGSECVGVSIHFGYSFKANEDWITGMVAVTVKQAAFSCEVASLNWPALKIEGGQFDKEDAPPGIVDFADLLPEAGFSVRPFCITLDAVPAEAVDRYFNGLPEEERRTQFPELDQHSVTPAGQDATANPVARVSHRMAIAFAQRAGERGGRNIELPTLQEYVAAAWEMQVKHPGTPDADKLLVMLRSGLLQWTSSACGANDSFWTIGPSAQGPLTKLCYEQSRLDRTGFRLTIK
jgi:hypothetical protein